MERRICKYCRDESDNLQKKKSSKYEPSYFGCGLFVLSLTIFHPHQQLRSLSSPFCPPCFTGGHIAAGEPAELAEQHLKIKSRHSAIVSKLLSVNFVVFVFMLIGEILRRELNNQCHILSIEHTDIFNQPKSDHCRPLLLTH